MQLFPQLGGILWRSEGIDEALEGGDGGVDLENAGGDCLSRVFLSVGEISPQGQLASGFKVLEAHPALEFSPKTGLKTLGKHIFPPRFYKILERIE